MRKKERKKLYKQLKDAEKLLVGTADRLEYDLLRGVPDKEIEVCVQKWRRLSDELDDLLVRRIFRIGRDLDLVKEVEK